MPSKLRVQRSGLRDLPLVDDSDGTFYFKGEGDRSIWLSPHDEFPSEPCDAAPEEIDVATAIVKSTSAQKTVDDLQAAQKKQPAAAPAAKDSAPPPKDGAK